MLNIIKYLSSKFCHTHTSTLLNITKALVLSKINYGLAVYGGCAKSNLNLISSQYNAAVRRFLRAFPTSPIKFLLVEAGLPSLEELASSATVKVIPMLFRCKNRLLAEAAKSVLSWKLTPSRKSAIVSAVKFAADHNLAATPLFQEISLVPPWRSMEKSFICDLVSLQKNSTCPEVYQQRFLELAHTFRNKGWSLLFTDASKNANATSFAVTNKDGKTIAAGLLSQLCSVFTAEAVAILQAVLLACNSNTMHVLCTDSLSSIMALLNKTNRSSLISRIRDKLFYNHNRIKIMWVPGHVGISGNVNADAAAKLALMQPLHFFYELEPNDLRNWLQNSCYKAKLSKWHTIDHHYVLINKDMTRPNYPAKISAEKIKTFTRLRIGHTSLTHVHLLSNLPKTNCPYCDCGVLTVIHILDQCHAFAAQRSQLFKALAPSTLLKQANADNINTIVLFLNSVNVNHLI